MTDHMPHWHPNPKSNHPAPIPQPEQGWTAVDVVFLLALAIFIVWCVAYGNGVGL
jgi:hypothetical protein